ncbi:hypothetical protein ABEV40_08720 [Geobacillus thermocatenulatus]|uniref:hypothetical protein n=1 Tax=Geobacillus thermocatenulatus TaxID=33938 RepID=UPI003D1B2480
MAAVAQNPLRCVSSAAIADLVAAFNWIDGDVWDDDRRIIRMVWTNDVASSLCNIAYSAWLNC